MSDSEAMSVADDSTAAANADNDQSPSGSKRAKTEPDPEKSPESGVQKSDEDLAEEDEEGGDDEDNDEDMNDYYDGSDYDFEMPSTDEEEGVTPVTPMERIKSYDATSQTKPSVSGFDKLCMAKKRLIRDNFALRKESLVQGSAAPDTNDVLKWKGCLFGPTDTPFEDGSFFIKLLFTEEYPFEPPQVWFKSKMFHPNIFADGEFSARALKHCWSPASTVADLLKVISNLLAEPYQGYIVNSTAWKLYSENRMAYNSRVRSCVKDSLEQDEDAVLEGIDVELADTAEKAPEPEKGVFEMIATCPPYHHFVAHPSHKKANSSFSKGAIDHLRKKDLPSLVNNLAPGIFVKGFEDRLDLFSVMMRGPEKTPYQDFLFFFDVSLPNTYPSHPPEVYFHPPRKPGQTVARGLGFRQRINPNLYDDGKVCLSLLGTWSGPGWQPGTSSLLQVLVSIQGLILVEQPFYNEPGFKVGQHYAASRDYSEKVVLRLIQCLPTTINDPPAIFTREVEEHFRLRKAKLLDLLEGWLEVSEATWTKIDKPKPAGGTLGSWGQLPSQLASAHASLKAASAKVTQLEQIMGIKKPKAGVTSKDPPAAHSGQTSQQQGGSKGIPPSLNKVLESAEASVKAKLASAKAVASSNLQMNEELYKTTMESQANYYQMQADYYKKQVALLDTMLGTGAPPVQGASKAQAPKTAASSGPGTGKATPTTKTGGTKKPGLTPAVMKSQLNIMKTQADYYQKQATLFKSKLDGAPKTDSLPQPAKTIVVSKSSAPGTSKATPPGAKQVVPVSKAALSAALKAAGESSEPGSSKAPPPSAKQVVSKDDLAAALKSLNAESSDPGTSPKALSPASDAKNTDDPQSNDAAPVLEPMPSWAPTWAAANVMASGGPWGLPMIDAGLDGVDDDPPELPEQMSSSDDDDWGDVGGYDDAWTDDLFDGPNPDDQVMIGFSEEEPPKETGESVAFGHWIGDAVQNLAMSLDELAQFDKEATSSSGVMKNLLLAQKKINRLRQIASAVFYVTSCSKASEVQGLADHAYINCDALKAKVTAWQYEAGTERDGSPLDVPSTKTACDKLMKDADDLVKTKGSLMVDSLMDIKYSLVTSFSQKKTTSEGKSTVQSKSKPQPSGSQQASSSKSSSASDGGAQKSSSEQKVAAQTGHKLVPLAPGMSFAVVVCSTVPFWPFAKYPGGSPKKPGASPKKTVTPGSTKSPETAASEATPPATSSAPAAAGTAPPQPGSESGPFADPDVPATLSSATGSWASWLPSLWGGPAAGPSATNDPSSPSHLPSGSGGVSKYKLYVKKPKTVVGQKEDVKEAVEAAAEQTRRPVPTFPLLPIRDTKSLQNGIKIFKDLLEKNDFNSEQNK